MKVKMLAAMLIAIPMMTMAAAQPHWTYEGASGPENWGTLSPEFATCHTGKFQSPVDITNTIDAKLPPLNLVFNTSAEKLVNNGHTIQVTVNSGDEFSLDGEKFRLAQYHFHVPGENKINGESFPMEAHFVHANAKGDLAVVAVMFKVGAENSALKPVLNSLPQNENETVDVKHRIDLKNLFPADQSYYRFSGSLTTPPCTEGLRWLVMRNSVTLSLQQLDVFQNALKHANNRPVQPMNGRIVVR